MHTGSLMTIGRFARLTRLSVKQLRRYDELGLLAPASVDDETGYRFYQPSQTRTAATIALLRELDVPLAVVRELLAADEARTTELLQVERGRRAADFERVARALAGLSQLAAEGALPDVAVRIRQAPPRRLAAVRAPADPQRMGAVTAQLAERLAAAVPDPSIPFTGLFPVDLPETFDVLLGVEVSDPPHGTEPIALAGAAVACAVHRGPVQTIALSWWPLLAWVHEHGLEPSGPLRERYLDDQLTHLAVPLAKD